MINLDHVHFQHKTVIYFVQTFGNIYTIVPFCKHALRVFHAIAWLILLAHAQTNFPPVVLITTCEYINIINDYTTIAQTIDNQRNGLETHAKVDATSVIRFVWNPVTSL